MIITVKEQRRLSQKIFENINAWLEKFVSFLVVSSLFVAITAFSVLYFSFLLFGINPNPLLLSAAFLVTLSIYSINKVTDKEEDSINVPERAGFIKGKELFLILFSALFYIIALLIGGLESGLAVPILSIPLFIGISYSVKIFPSIHRLKDVFVANVLIVTLSWVLLATFLPAIYLWNNTLIFLIFIFLFIKLFINAVLFNVKDVEGDRQCDVKTIPGVLGINRTKKLLLVLNSLLIPWLAVSIYLGLFTKYLPILIFCIAYGYWYIIHFCKEKAGKFSYDLVIDGEWMLLVFLCFIIRSIHF